VSANGTRARPTCTTSGTPWPGSAPSTPERYGAAPKGEPDGTESPGVLEALRRTGAKLIGRSEVSGLLLLRDLRHLYLSAQNAEITWVILLQTARAVRDAELIETASECHEEAEARGKWLRTRIKESCPQVLASG
jgi:hypothetical protein